MTLNTKAVAMCWACDHEDHAERFGKPLTCPKCGSAWCNRMYLTDDADDLFAAVGPKLRAGMTKRAVSALVSHVFSRLDLAAVNGDTPWVLERLHRQVAVRAYDHVVALTFVGKKITGVSPQRRRVAVSQLAQGE